MRSLLVYSLIKFLSVSNTFAESLWIEAVVLTIVKSINILFVTLTKLGIVLILLDIIKYREYKPVEITDNKKSIFENKKLVSILNIIIFTLGEVYNGMQLYILQPNDEVEIVAHR